MKFGLCPRWKRVKIIAINGATVTCQADKVDSWLMGEELVSAALSS